MPERRRPDCLDLPTGLGKNSVMAVWYLAARASAKLPRRLVYVVDQRAVVDQATTETEKIKAKHANLLISTLRGQHADNQDWLEDPAAPAIIVGTVDMIGSRLLFSGYGVSRKLRPYQAGLPGADTLLVLDESHLLPPFEELLRSIAGDDEAFGPRVLSNCEATHHSSSSCKGALAVLALRETEKASKRSPVVVSGRRDADRYKLGVDCGHGIDVFLVRRRPQCEQFCEARAKPASQRRGTPWARGML